MNLHSKNCKQIIFKDYLTIFLQSLIKIIFSLLKIIQMYLNLIKIKFMQTFPNHFLEQLYFSDFRIRNHFVSRHLIIIFSHPFFNRFVKDDWIWNISYYCSVF